jgi:hypothetical protein
MLTYLMFGSNRPKSSVLDPAKPLLVLAGSDSFEDITQGITNSSNPRTWIESWNNNFPKQIQKRIFISTILQKSHCFYTEKSASDAAATDPSKYPEQIVDIMRSEKEYHTQTLSMSSFNTISF